MKTGRSVPTAVVFASLVFVSTAMADDPITPEAYARINAALVERHVLPGYERLAAATKGFARGVTEACGDADGTNLVALRARFHEVMDTWMAVQHLRFGPVESFTRGQRFYFWPEARGKVRKAVGDVLAISDTESLAPARFAGVNVAVQGLLTVELLLFGDEPPLADRKHCALLTAIAHNLHNMAADILADWSVGGGGFATVVASAGPTNAQFASHKEATLAFFKSLHDGLQLLAEARIKPVLGGSLAEAQPRFAESRLSGRALRNIVINLKAFQGLYGDVANPGLGAITQNVDPKLDRLLRKAFRVTIATARSIEQPLDEVVVDMALRPQAEKLRTQVVALGQIVRTRLSQTLDLAAGFNALDGD